MNVKCNSLKVILNKVEKILKLVSPDLYNLKLDIKKLFNLTDEQMKNINLFAKPVAIKGTSIEVKLENEKDYNVFVLDQQNFADYIIIRCELKGNKGSDKEIIEKLKSKILYLENENQNIKDLNKNLKINENNHLSNLKEKENYINSLNKKLEEKENNIKSLKKKLEEKENNIKSLKKKLEDKEQINSSLKKKNFSYKNLLKNFLKLAYLNNLHINFHVNSSLYQSINSSFSQPPIIFGNKNKYDYEFIENDSSLEIKKEEIKNKKIFDFYFKIKNQGAEFPVDTLLKCIPNDNYIYFFHLKITDGVWSYKDENLGIIYVFPVKILFKNYNKFNNVNELSCYLLSDRYGKIGNKIGKMKIIVSDI